MGLRNKYIICIVVLAVMVSGGIVSAAGTDASPTNTTAQLITPAVSSPENEVLPYFSPEINTGIVASCPGGVCDSLSAQPVISGSVSSATGYSPGSGDILPASRDAQTEGQVNVKAPGVGPFFSGEITPTRYIYPGTHPAVLLYPPYISGHQEEAMVYFNDSRYLWLAYGSLAANPEWYGSLDLNTASLTRYSPAICLMPSTIIYEIFVVDTTGIWEKDYNGVWSDWHLLPIGSDVASTPGVVSRSGGNTEIVYVNQSGYLIHVTNTSGTWSAGEVIDESHSFTDEGVSLVSESSDSFDVIGHSISNDHWTRHWSQSGGWGSWIDTGLAAHSFVGASTRTYSNAGGTLNTIDLVFDKTGDQEYYWNISKDTGATWTYEQYTSSHDGLVVEDGGPEVILSPHYNRVEFLQEDDGKISEKIFRAPTNSTVGVYKDGTWLLDYDGSGGWNTGDKNYGFGASGWTPVVGDWNGDGRDKMGLYKDGTWIVDSDGSGGWTTGDGISAFGTTGWMPVVGDWNSNGRDKIGIYKDGTWLLDYDGSGGWNTGDKNYAFGTTGWTSVVGDWTGDGKSKIGIYKDGTWLLDYDGSGGWNTGDKNYAFGTTGWTPVVGDWNGDGHTEIGVYKDGTWLLDYDGSGGWNTGDKIYSLGSSGMTPVVGDWNGDGKTEIGATNNALWYLDTNGDGVSDKTISFGASGWTPLVAGWY